VIVNMPGAPSTYPYAIPGDVFFRAFWTPVRNH